MPCTIQGVKDLIDDDVNLPPLKDFLLTAETDWLLNFPDQRTEENELNWNKLTNILLTLKHYEDHHQFHDDDELDQTTIHTTPSYQTKTSLGQHEQDDFFDDDHDAEDQQDINSQEINSTISSKESHRTGQSLSGNYSTTTTHTLHFLTSLLLLGSSRTKRKFLTADPYTTSNSLSGNYSTTTMHTLQHFLTSLLHF